MQGDHGPEARDTEGRDTEGRDTGSRTLPVFARFGPWLLGLFFSKFGLEFGDFLLQALDFLVE